jgi:predicted RNase H-like nuclease (RuvC/YqgF family)
MRERNEIIARIEESKRTRSWYERDLKEQEARMAAGVHSLHEAENIDREIQSLRASIKAQTFQIDALEWAAKVGIYEE